MCKELKSKFTGCDCKPASEVEQCGRVEWSGAECELLDDPIVIEDDGKCFDCQEMDRQNALNAEQEEGERVLELSRLQLEEDNKRRAARNTGQLSDDDDELQVVLKASEEESRNPGEPRDEFDDDELHAAIQASMEETQKALTDSDDEELAQIMKLSMEETQKPHNDSDGEDLAQIIKLSMESTAEDEERRKQAQASVGKYRLHMKYHGCGCEADVGETDIEHDREAEGLPYLVEDIDGQCPNCGGESSTAVQLPAEGRLPGYSEPDVPAYSTAEPRCDGLLSDVRDDDWRFGNGPARDQETSYGSDHGIEDVFDSMIRSQPPVPISTEPSARTVHDDPGGDLQQNRKNLQDPTIWHPDHPEELVDRPLVIIPDEDDEEGYMEGGNKEEYRKEQMLVDNSGAKRGEIADRESRLRKLQMKVHEVYGKHPDQPDEDENDLPPPGYATYIDLNQCLEQAKNELGIIEEDGEEKYY
ncbi:hypothetical protein P152DRAFT_494637 [Eremomyces bilateralis CBS 781.70]|uniref:Uncharacterized protein n=1 Tax=Eremomyces bilateralis CBS 781.70 TaxID=1392243 RepID=A0A6G1FTZ8_9PEZI|nr:uncharacterized protein P152DRAFT_494637 [Eremomyces bilateralis CBS 781.70]KAF1809365.1 hypothetical protein P152DRAFT_494637 [Eremomyces bilateralis CBS 781.70]